MVFSCIITVVHYHRLKCNHPICHLPSPSILSETLFWSFPSVFTPSSPWRHTADHWGGALVYSDWMGWKGSFPLKTCAVLSEYTFVTSVLTTLAQKSVAVSLFIFTHFWMCLEKFYTTPLLAPSHYPADFQPHDQWSPASRLACERKIWLRDKENDKTWTHHKKNTI